jgi:pterin-4a-carbinolamine dehydratase
MPDHISPQDFLASEGTEDWRLTSEGAIALSPTKSFAESARFVQAIGEIPRVEDHRPAVDIATVKGRA